MSSLMPTCLWPPTSHRYIEVVVEVVVDDGVDVVVDDGVDVVVVITDADILWPLTSHRYTYVVVVDLTFEIVINHNCAPPTDGA